MKQVLFVCTQNAGRSQIAEALFNRMAPSDVRAESAGQDPRTEGVWPPVIEVMAEIGIDLSQKRPRKLLPEMQLHADWAITLACGASCPYVPTIVEDWDIPDHGRVPPRCDGLSGNPRVDCAWATDAEIGGAPHTSTIFDPNDVSQ